MHIYALPIPNAQTKKFAAVQGVLRKQPLIEIRPFVVLNVRCDISENL